MFWKMLVASLLLVPDRMPPMDQDNIERAIAVNLVLNPTGERYPSRASAVLMDDNPGVRRQLKKYVIEEGWMLGYQANRFDGGFGAAMFALHDVREIRTRWLEKQLPSYPIQRGIDP